MKIHPELEKTVALAMSPPMDPVGNLYHDLGEDRLRQLIGAFYRRMRQDDLIGPMYPPNDWEGSEKRLADYLIYRFGGPQTYLEERGHPRLRGRHMPFTIGIAERDRWLDLMGASMREVEIPTEHVPVIGAFFAQIADFMRNREEPA